MEGRGKFLYPDGRIYEVMFRDDLKNGFGIFYWTDGRRYEGNWLHGKQHGRGKYFSQGSIKEGIWVEGIRKKWL